MQERNLCSQAITAFLWLTSTRFGWRRSKRKFRSHKIDNCYKLWLRESVMHPFRPSPIPALFFFFSRKNLLQTLLPPLIRLFTLICSEVLWYPSVFLDSRYVAPPLIHCTIYASICSPFCKEIGENQSINKWINAREDKALSSLDKCLSIHVNSWDTI